MAAIKFFLFAMLVVACAFAAEQVREKKDIFLGAGYTHPYLGYNTYLGYRSLLHPYLY